MAYLSAAMSTPFGAIAAEYDSWYDSEEGIAIFREEVEALLLVKGRAPGRWLEVGVGTGRFASALNVSDGVDPSEEMLSLAVSDEVRLFSRIYLRGMAIMGTAFGTLPSALQFDLTELISFGRMSKGKWVPTHFYGANKLYGRVAIEFPDYGSTPYNLANVVMIDRSRTRIFVAGGTSWTSLDEFGKTSPNVEVGVEEALDVSALGGLLPFRATVGYAMPILGDGMGVFYFGFSL